MSYEIISAHIGYIEQLLALEAECFSMPMTKEQLISQLPDNSHAFLLAVEGDKLLGYVGMMYVLDEGYISNVAVSPDSRRMHIADNLLQELERRAKILQLAFITLEVRAGNAPAISLYSKHGFVPVGLRKNYYDKPKEDAILMTKYFKRGKRIENSCF